MSHEVSPSSYLSKHALFFLTLFSLTGLFLFLFLTSRRIFFPYALDSCESYSLHRALRFASKQPVYRSTKSPPFLLSNYPPIYEYLTSLFLRKPTFFWGRLISYLSYTFVLLLIVIIVWQRTHSISISLVAAASPLFSRSAWAWMALHRVDALALFWNTLALALYLKTKRPLLTIPFLIGAGYTKQSFLALPIAIFLWTYRVSRKEAFVFLFLYAFVGFSILMVASFFTDFQFIYHTIYYNFTPSSWRRAVDMSLRPLGKCFAIWLLIAFHHYCYKKFEFLHLYAFCSYAVLVLTSGKLGSSWNYFLELGVVMALLWGDTLHLCLVCPLRPSRRVFYLLLGIQLLYSISYLSQKEKDFWRRWTKRLSAKQKLKRLLSNLPAGQILCENVEQRTKIPATDVVVLSGHTLALNIHYYLMIKGKLWNPAPLQNAIRQQRFSVVILDRPVGSVEAKIRPRWKYLRQSYVFWTTVGPYVLYRPKKR